MNLLHPRRVYHLPILVLAGLVILASACGGGKTATVTVTDGGPSSTTSAPPASSAPVAHPKGTVTGTCDYVLGNFSEGPAGYRFVADAKLDNTGNVGLVVEAKAVFAQLGTRPVIVAKTAKVKPGQVVVVHLTHDASSDELDLLQSANGDCHVNGKMLRTFGTPR